jgi:hypothetical protein
VGQATSRFWTAVLVTTSSMAARETTVTATMASPPSAIPLLEALGIHISGQQVATVAFLAERATTQFLAAPVTTATAVTAAMPAAAAQLESMASPDKSSAQTLWQVTPGAVTAVPVDSSAELATTSYSEVRVMMATAETVAMRPVA